MKKLIGMVLVLGMFGVKAHAGDQETFGCDIEYRGKDFKHYKVVRERSAVLKTSEGNKAEARTKAQVKDANFTIDAMYVSNFWFDGVNRPSGRDKIVYELTINDKKWKLGGEVIGLPNATMYRQIVTGDLGEIEGRDALSGKPVKFRAVSAMLDCSTGVFAD